MTIIICIDCKEKKPHYGNGLCERCWRKQYYTKHKTSQKEYSRAYSREHGAEVQQRVFQRQACGILIEHAEQHKNDDDRLTTGFITEQLKKFKGKIYDKKDMDLLSQTPSDINENE